MEVDEGPDVNVAHPVSVSAHENVIGDVRFDALDSSPGHGVQAGIGEGDSEVLLQLLPVVGDRVPMAERDGEVPLHRFVVQEVILDHVSAIAQTEHEFIETVMRIELHDVPQEGMATDIHQWLGPELRFLPEAGAEPTAKDDYLQIISAQDGRSTAQV